MTQILTQEKPAKDGSQSQFTTEQVKRSLQAGLMSFPLTDFDRDGQLDIEGFKARLAWLREYGASAVFIAGGAGEFFSLSFREYSRLIAAGVSERGNAPVIATAGYGTQLAVEYAQEAERLGADGILVLPPYLTESTQSGISAHYKAVCQSTSLPVIIYNRANGRIGVDALEELCRDCPNLVGFKDGVGDIEELLRIRSRLGQRLACVNGMPTAEVYAAAYASMGAPAYSSAIFNFVPKSAMAFHDAVIKGDSEWLMGFVRDFLDPYCRLRTNQPGYAVSLVKAGAYAVGRSAGGVRAPLSEVTPDELAQLKTLIARLGPQEL